MKGDLPTDTTTVPINESLKGVRLWRSYDKQWEDLMSGQTAERRISARFLLEETEQGFRLTFTAEDGTQRSEEYAAEHQPARTDQTAPIRDVLSKLGDTPYACKDIEVRFSQPWFIPRRAGLILAQADGETTHEEIELILSRMSEFHMFPKDVLIEVSKEDPYDVFNRSVQEILREQPSNKEQLFMYLVDLMMADRSFHHAELDLLTEIAQKTFQFDNETFLKLIAFGVQRGFLPSMESISGF